ncbi:MAG: 4-hydroxy-tetrahydrodipicolinate synthase [Bacteroidia bacterium]|nr:4-hydroxy-tetrahydrodipicolinate synthase [Bacteroidia bacterium]MDW8157764.1 4-hydroxy-tetrahydrodipicolinate synthase [Bacteroidia bacterium]
MQFKGTGVAIVTPFQFDGTIDYSALKKLILHLIEGGVDYIVAFGSTGENPTISQEEIKNTIIFIHETLQGRIPLILGCGGNDTAAVIKAMKNYAQNLPIDAFLSVCPAYNKPTQKGLFEHFSAIAENSPLPVILYNVPSRTACNLLPSTVLELVQRYSNLIGIKESSGNLEQGMEIIRNKPENFLVLAGDDILALPAIALGFDGAISVIANAYPKLFSNLVKSALEGKWKNAQKSHYLLMELMQLIFKEGNPTGIKALLSILGICKPHVRLPLVEASKELYHQLQAATLKVSVV